MTDTEHAQIYLITPPAIDLADFPDRLARVLDGHTVACVRLALATADDGDLSRAADTLRAVCHARDIPLVIESHFRLVANLGLDGVHLPGGAPKLRRVREALGADAIIGAHCGASYHAGLSAGEAGADYVSFGPVAESPLGDGSVAERETFALWSEMIELPVVAEGALSPHVVADLAPVVDFFAVGPEIWASDDPLSALNALFATLPGTAH